MKIDSSQKTLASFFVSCLVIFLLVGFWLWQNEKFKAVDSLTRALFNQADSLALWLPEEKLTSGLLKEMDQELKALANHTQTRITLINKDGKVLTDTAKAWEEIEAMENHAGRPEVAKALGGRRASVSRHSDTTKIQYIYCAIPLLKQETIYGVLRLSLAIPDLNQILLEMLKPIIIGLLFGVIGVSFVGYLFFIRTMRQIDHINKTALRYAKGDLSKKLGLGKNSNLNALTQSLNDMATSLEERIRELDSEKSKNALILENMKEGVIAVNDSYEVTLINPSALHMLALEPSKHSALLGKTLLQITHNQDIDEMIRSSVRSQEMLSREIHFPYLGGKTLQVAAMGVLKKENDLAGILVLTDMTKVRELENLRREFVANVSHELKTPLTSIRGFIETLLGGALKNESTAANFLTMMDEDTRRLSRLIDELLELSKIESGQMILSLKPISVSEEIEKVTALFQTKLSEKKISVRNSFDKKTAAAEIQADPDKIRQVLVNLMDNAIKFNKISGQITWSIKIQENSVQISITDTGSGIPEEAIGRVFERFYRVDKARSRELGGTGLGLSIVKHIVEAHGGSVSCDSRLGDGTTFTITIPKIGEI